MKRKSTRETSSENLSKKRRKYASTSSNATSIESNTKDQPISTRIRSKISNVRPSETFGTRTLQTSPAHRNTKNIKTASKEKDRKLDTKETVSGHSSQTRSNKIHRTRIKKESQDSNVENQKTVESAPSSTEIKDPSTTPKKRTPTSSQPQHEEKSPRKFDLNVERKAEEALKKHREEWEIFDSFDLETTEEKKFDSEELNPAPLASPATPEPTFLIQPDRSELNQDDFLNEELGIKKTPKVIGSLPRPSLPPMRTPQDKEKYISEIKKQMECMDSESKRVFLLGLRKSLLRQSLTSRSVTSESTSASPSQSPTAKEVSSTSSSSPQPTSDTKHRRRQ